MWGVRLCGSGCLRHSLVFARSLLWARRRGGVPWPLRDSLVRGTGLPWVERTRCSVLSLAGGGGSEGRRARCGRCQRDSLGRPVVRRCVGFGPYPSRGDRGGGWARRPRRSPRSSLVADDGRPSLLRRPCAPLHRLCCSSRPALSSAARERAPLVAPPPLASPLPPRGPPLVQQHTVLYVCSSGHCSGDVAASTAICTDSRAEKQKITKKRWSERARDDYPAGGFGQGWGESGGAWCGAWAGSGGGHPPPGLVSITSATYCAVLF